MLWHLLRKIVDFGEKSKPIPTVNVEPKCSVKTGEIITIE